MSTAGSTSAAASLAASLDSGAAASRAASPSESAVPEVQHVDVSVVLPCLDEELALPGVMASARRLLDIVAERHGLSGEVVVADNGSTDNSVTIATAAGARVVHCAQRGYGNALRAGFGHARGRFLVMGDTDGSYDFEDAVPMIERLLDGYEVCMGSRFKGEILPGAMPILNRYVGNPLLTGVLNLFFRSGCSDAHCGLRSFTREAIRKIRPSAAGMELASEIVLKAALLNLRRTEVPITLHPDGRDRPPHLRPWRDGWRHLRYLLMLSPRWLYFGPALTLGLLGLALFAVLLSQPSGEMVRLGSIVLGDHWMPLGSVAIGLSHLGFLMGLAATMHGVQEGYRLPSRRLRFTLAFTRLDLLLLIGVSFALTGLALFAYVVYVWQVREITELHRIREMIASATLVQLGAQTILGGFMLSVLRGNRAEPYFEQ